MTTTRRTLRATLVAAATAAALFLGACGGGGAGGAEVASISGDDQDGGGDDTATGSADRGRLDPEFEDAMLEFAQCMRDHGIDMPDPQSDGGGLVAVGPGRDGGGIDPSSEEFEAADEACSPILEEAAPDIELDPEEQARMQDQLLDLAECMREKGFDMPDPQVDENGRVEIGVAAGAAGGSNEGGPRFDEDFQEAMEECHEEVGMEFGPGGGRVTSENR